MKTLHFFFHCILIATFVLASSGTKAQYCNVSWTSGGVEPITLVDFGSINNATSNTSTVGLENYTSLSTNVLQGSSYTITVKCNTMGNYTNYIRVYIDWNQDLDFTDAGEDFNIGTITNSTGVDNIQVTGSIQIPVTSSLGNTRMRVLAKWNSYATSCNSSGYGQAEDYTINILSGNSCTGTPNPGVASGPSAVCPNIPFNVSISGHTSASGISIQWQQDNGVGWQNITGATNATYGITSGITSPISYRAYLTCLNGGGNDVSNAVSVAVNLPTQCYCAISYPSSGSGPISLVSFEMINNITSANVNQPSYEDFTNLAASIMQGQTSIITVKGNTVGNYTDSVKVYFDWDQNGFFTDPGETYYVGNLVNTTGTDAVQVATSIIVPSNAAMGTTRMRVTKKYQDLTYSGPCNSTGYGQAEDYTVNVLAANTCVGKPLAGTATAPATICPSTSFNLSLSGYTVAAGITMQWQEDISGLGNWQSIPGATTPVYNMAGISASANYRAIVNCSNGNQQDTSNTVSISVLPAAQCYCTIAFSGGVEPITLVDFANLYNATSDTVNASPESEDYTAMSATVAINSSYTLTVKGNTNGSYTDYIRAFIDWNQNGTFGDPGESYNVGTITNSTGLDLVQATLSIQVPSGASVGSTRMRVTKRWSAYATECNTSGWGQAEDYTIIVGWPLAIKLRDISALHENGKNVVRWITAHEANGDYFQLERSADGYQFVGIATVFAKGVAAAYTFDDLQPLPGTNYYRLKMNNASGDAAYSKTVSVHNRQSSQIEFTASPNPVRDVVTVQVQGAITGKASLAIIDITGKVILESALENTSAKLNTSHLASGIYLLKYQDDRYTHTIRICK